MGGQASGQDCALFHISWALNSAHLAATGYWHWAGNQDRRLFYHISNNRFTTGDFLITQGKYISTAPLSASVPVGTCRSGAGKVVRVKG